MSDSDRINRQDESVSLPKSGELSPGSDLESLGEVFQGFIFHVGINSVGRQFCHLRYMRIRGKYIQMFKRDPNLFPGEEPIRRGVAGRFLMVEELGCQKIIDRELYMLKISSRVGGKRMGEIACVTAEDARNWKTAFQQAKDEGYWVVKRAVGTKACLLGKAVTCTYHRQDNFLEIDIDIGSSSVARSVVNIALGYVTSIVVDLAILIEAKEEHELPEYLLGTVRINRVRTESAVPLSRHSDCLDKS